MLVDWRVLFDELRTPWRDRGRNSSRGNVNICCPWCGSADQGYHLAVSEDNDAYYCFRRPNEHSGSNVTRLVVALGLKRSDAIAIINQYTVGKKAPEAPKEQAADFKRWAHFQPATQSVAHLSYLEERGFSKPFETANRYDLRCVEAGKWAFRLLFPLTALDEMQGWTGRAIISRLQPKYLGYDGNLEGAIYLPRPPRAYMIVVEGPMDALKIAAATEAYPIAAMALLGKQLSASRLLRARKVLQHCRDVCVVLDADTSGYEALRAVEELRKSLLHTSAPPFINKKSLPRFVKDAGEMSEVEVLEWLQQTTAWFDP